MVTVRMRSLGAVGLLFVACIAQAGQRFAVFSGSMEDQGWNQLIVAGAEAFERQRGVTVAVYGFSLDPLAALRLAIDEGATDIVLTGFQMPEVAEAIREEVGRVRFTVIDGGLDDRTVRTLQFRAEEASFLAGMVAARRSRSGRIGFIGAMPVAGISNFGCAFAQGARSVRPDANIDVGWLGTTILAFSEPTAGRAKADQMLAAGNDVLFAAAGGSGLGVLAAAADASAWSIGVDANQNGLYPGRVLTSVLKRMDVAVYTALVEMHEGRWSPGENSVGLAEGAVGLALDDHNRALIGSELLAELDDAEFGIVSGEIVVTTIERDDQPCAHAELDGMAP